MDTTSRLARPRRGRGVPLPRLRETDWHQAPGYGDIAARASSRRTVHLLEAKGQAVRVSTIRTLAAPAVEPAELMGISR